MLSNREKWLRGREFRRRRRHPLFNNCNRTLFCLRNIVLHVVTRVFTSQRQESLLLIRETRQRRHYHERISFILFPLSSSFSKTLLCLCEEIVNLMLSSLLSLKSFISVVFPLNCVAERISHLKCPLNYYCISLWLNACLCCLSPWLECQANGRHDDDSSRLAFQWLFFSSFQDHHDDVKGRDARSRKHPDDIKMISNF